MLKRSFINPVGDMIRIKTFKKFISDVKIRYIEPTHDVEQPYELVYPSKHSMASYFNEKQVGTIPTDDFLDRKSFLPSYRLEDMENDFWNNKREVHIFNKENIDKVCYQGMHNYRQNYDVLVKLSAGTYALLDSSDWTLFKTQPETFEVFTSEGIKKITAIRMGLMPNKLAPINFFTRM